MIFNWLKFIKWLATPHFHVEISEKCNYFEIMDSYWLKFIKWLATPHFHVEISEKCNYPEIMDSYWLKFIMWLATANQNANFHCRVTSLLWNGLIYFGLIILFSRSCSLGQKHFFHDWASNPGWKCLWLLSQRTLTS